MYHCSYTTKVNIDVAIFLKFYIFMKLKNVVRIIINFFLRDHRDIWLSKVATLHLVLD